LSLKKKKKNCKKNLKKKKKNEFNFLFESFFHGTRPVGPGWPRMQRWRGRAWRLGH
jgi:hypothetical protein